MNLTKSLRAVVVDRFKEGIPIAEIALWYRVPAVKIEAVIRDAMNQQRGVHESTVPK